MVNTGHHLKEIPGAEVVAIPQETEEKMPHTGTNNLNSDENLRGKWTNQFGFFLSCLGYAAGLGNVWRFPYLCYKNGGGAFLIPYTVMLVVCGLPLFYLELSLGQYHGKGPNVIFKHLVPVFHGLGFAMLMVSLLVSLYYNMIVAWTIYYFFASFTSELGWERCGYEWNSLGCLNADQNIECESMNMTYWNNTCFDAKEFCLRLPNMTSLNVTHCTNGEGDPVRTIHASKRLSPSEDYYLYNVLGLTSGGLEMLGEFRWQLILCLLLAWIIVALCLMKGVHSTGKVVYFTALFPYIVLIILLVHGLTLDGAAEGIYFYIIPDWQKLASTQVWCDAAVQIFYSFGPGFGGLLTLASYNKFHNNCQRDAVIVGVATFATSILAGFVIFSILGFMSKTLDVDIENVIQSGPGLAFIVYPEAVSKMPLPQVWSILFFLMLITLGLDSQFAMCQTLITGIQDEWPILRQWNSSVTVVICSLCFLLGLPLCTRGGIYLFDLLDKSSAGWALLLVAFLEIAIVVWIYGLRKFKSNITEMLGSAPNLYWTISWALLAPLAILEILVFTWMKSSPAKIGEVLPSSWSDTLSWLIASASVIMVPIFAIYEVIKAIIKKKPLKSLIRATEKWGPADQPMKVENNRVLEGCYNNAFSETICQ